MSLRWGIMGAARIARKLVPVIAATGGEVRAVAASTLERARDFAAECKIPRALEGYAALLELDEINAVYLPLSNGLHFQWALACARAGKHCLCEKPLVLTGEEALQLREEFRRADRRLMEAFMWRHHPQTEWIHEQLRGGRLGRLRRIAATFAFTLDRPDDYRWSDEQGGGSFWDLGCYCVNAMRLFFGEEPERVSGVFVPVRPGGLADRSAAGWLDFGHGRLGVFDCSFEAGFMQRLSLFGTEGTLVVHRPFVGLAGGSRAWLQTEDQIVEHALEQSNAYERMIVHFTRAAHDPSFALQPGEDGCLQARAMEAIRASAGEAASPPRDGT